MNVFDISKQDHLSKKMFFDEPVDIARYDVVKYPFFNELTDKQLGFFWRPEEIECTKDAKDFRALTDHEQHIFTSNLKRQILLDSVQGRAPSLALLPISSLPEIENWIQTWAFNETIHSRSYTHIIRNIYANPSIVFDAMLDIPEILDCAKDISARYDDLIYAIGEGKLQFTDYERKKMLWFCLNSINALEGIRFYVSFACSWAFGELKNMEGNAKIIKLICRDENLHLAGTQQLLKLLVKDDSDFAKIKEETEEEVLNDFIAVVNQEKKWAEYLFKAGSIIGLNTNLLVEYIEWVAHKRMTTIGIKSPYKGGSNPLPWTQHWISGSEVQMAPQEVTISSYVSGGVKMDVDENVLGNLQL